METTLIAGKRARTGQMPPLGRPPAQAPWSEDDGLLILDARGQVVFCSRSGAAILGRKACGIVGRPVTSLLPALPFHASMPAFNLAYIATLRNGGRVARTVTSVEGRPIALELFPGGIDGIDDRSIVVILKSSTP